MQQPSTWEVYCGKLKNVTSFPVSYWLLSAAVICQYSAIYPTFFFVSRMMTINYGIGPVMAGSLFGLIHLTAAFLLPAIGNYVDRYGGITVCMIYSALTGLIVNALWLLIPADVCTANNTCLHFVILPILLSGMSYALVAGTAWNGTFYLIERSNLGTAQGVQQSLMSLLLLLIPLLFGYLVDHSLERRHGYYDPMLMQLAISVLSIIINLINYCYDQRWNEKILALSVEERNALINARRHRQE